MRRPRVFLDANVLVDAQVRDLFCRLAEAELIDLRWSDQILAETRRALVNRLKLDPSKVDRLIAALRRAFPLSEVDGFDHLNDAFDLPDPDDRHVVAAAVHDECDLLVTFNERDIPDSAVDESDLLVLGVDDAVVLLAGQFNDHLAAVVEAQVGALRRPALTIEEFLQRLSARVPIGALAIGAAMKIERFEDMFRQAVEVNSAASPQEAVRNLVSLVSEGRVDDLAAVVDPDLAARLTGLLEPTAAETHRALVVALDDVLNTDGWGFGAARRLHAPGVELVKLLRLGNSPRVSFTPEEATGHLFYMSATDDGWVLVDLDGPDPALPSDVAD